MSRFKKQFCAVLAAVSGLILASNLPAAFVWTDDTGNHNWNDPLNWNNGVPDTSSACRVDSLPGAIINADTPVVGNVHIGRYKGNPGAVTVNAGVWGVNYWLTLGREADASLTMNGGSVGTVVGSNLLLIVGNGSGCTGTLNMNGGTIRTQRGFKIGNDPGSIGHVNLHDGTIECDKFTMARKAARATMTLTHGTLIIDGNRLPLIQGYIDDGSITAFDNGSEILKLDYDKTNPGKTTLQAVDPLQPCPTHDVTVFSGPVELTWTLPEPIDPTGSVSCDVYWGTAPKSDFLKVVDRQPAESVVVDCPPRKTFYWQVIVYDNSAGPEPVLKSSVYTFNTHNLPPKVEAGEDTRTWLTDGTAAVTLEGKVTDQGRYTVKWTNITSPAPGPVTIADPDAEETTATFHAAGTYELQLDADDGQLTGADTLTVLVYADRCETVKSRPDYIPLVGDLNGDCRVDILDLKLLAQNRLQSD